MFLQYLLSKFDALEDISKPIAYGLDILEKTREFSSIDDVCYLFGCLQRAEMDFAVISKGVKAAAASSSSARRAGRDPIATIESMTPGFKRYVSVYDDDDDFI
jgi:hypothetical protein